MWDWEELHWRLSLMSRLIIGLCLFLIAFGLRYLTLPIDAGLAFVTFYPAILLALYICGAEIGLLVGLASGLAGSYFFIPPYGQFHENIFGITSLFFLVTLSVMTLLIYRVHRYAKYMQLMLNNDLVGSIRVKNRKIVWVNNAITSMFGYSSKELVGSSTRILYPDNETFEKLGQVAYFHVIKGETYRTQIQLQQKNGELIWADLSGSSLEIHSSDSLWMINDISEFKKLESELSLQARYDFLTSLPNRRYFMEQATMELHRANRFAQPLSMMMVDIDFFKKVNDTYGHQSGDLVLKSLAETIKAACREVDIIGRLGGEEFAVLMPATSIQQAIEVAERVRIVVENLPISLPQGGLPVKITVSIGVSVLSSSADNVDLVLHKADNALYEAKNTGRNKVCVEGD